MKKALQTLDQKKAARRCAKMERHRRRRLDALGLLRRINRHDRLYQRLSKPRPFDLSGQNPAVVVALRSILTSRGKRSASRA